MYDQKLREPRPEELDYIKEQMRAYMRKTGISRPGTVRERVAKHVSRHHGDIDTYVGYGHLCDIILELCPSIQSELGLEQDQA